MRNVVLAAPVLAVAAIASCADVRGAQYAAPGLADGGATSDLDGASGPTGTNSDGGVSTQSDSSTTSSSDASAFNPGSNAGPANVAASGGVDFRVWAPHATAARVTGDFPEGSVTMTAIAGGVFTAHVAGAHAGSIYLYSLDTSAGTITRTDPYCRELAPNAVDSAAGESCVVIDPSSYAWQTSSFTRPTREQSIVYELHIGSFSATLDFKGALAKLDDLKDLGINVIEVMPVNDFGSNPNGWGYNPELWLAPKQAYGAPDDLRALVDGAHARGIAVWADVVVNHYTGYTSAPLFCFDGYCPSGSAGDLFFPAGSAYQTTPYGPRPDYTEPEVSNMILAMANQWLTEFHGDGFRWDSVSNIRAIDGQGVTPGGQALLVAANALTHSLGGESVAEDLKGYAAITQAPSAGGFGFDAQWDGFGYDVCAQLDNTSDAARDMSAIQNDLTSSYAGDPYARLLFLEDHDTVGNGGLRLPNMIDNANPDAIDARQRDMLGGVMLLTAPGVPMLFQGEEFLATGTFPDPPPVLSAPTAHGSEIRAFYKDMIALRRTIPGLSAPAISIVQRNDTAKVIAYARGGALVIVNMMNKAYTEYDVGVPSAGPWNVRMNTQNATYADDLTTGQTGAITARAGAKDGFAYTLPLQLGAYAAMIVTQ